MMTLKQFGKSLNRWTFIKYVVCIGAALLAIESRKWLVAAGWEIGHAKIVGAAIAVAVVLIYVVLTKKERRRK